MFNKGYLTLVYFFLILLLPACTGSVNNKRLNKDQKADINSHDLSKNSGGGDLTSGGVSRKIPAKFLEKLNTFPECNYLVKDIKQVPESDIINCFEKVLYGSSPIGLLEYLIQRTDFKNLSENTLDELLELFVYLRAKEFSIIKQLIERGASTHNINLPLIANYENGGLDNSAKNCKTIEMIIANNRKLYLAGTLLTGKSQTKGYSDLHNLTRTFEQWYICHDAVRLLVKYSPRMRNINNEKVGTPLRQLLSDFSKVDRDPELAKVLMTKTNVNIQDKIENGGNTPLHVLLLYSLTNRPDFKAKEKYTVKAMLDMGANIDIKNKAGITARELILKRGDLQYLLGK